MLYFFIKDQEASIFIKKEFANSLLSLSFEKGNNKEVENILAKTNRNYIYIEDFEGPIFFRSLRRLLFKKK